jgi:hypothetical protein
MSLTNEKEKKKESYLLHYQSTCCNATKHDVEYINEMESVINEETKIIQLV